MQVSRLQAVLMIALAAVLWSTGGFLIKLVEWHPMAINGARSAVAFMVMLLYVRRPRFTWSRPQIAGALSYAAVTASFTAATKLTTAANAIFIQFTAPVYVALFSMWLLKEPVSRRDWLAIAAVMGGLFLFLLDNLTVQGYWGIILAVVSSLTLASLILSLRRQKDESPVETVMLGSILGAMAGLPFMLGPGPRVEAWAWIALLGVFQMGIPFVLQSIAITRLAAVEVISIQVLEPILNPVWVFFLVGEMPGRWAIIGGTIVLAAVTARSIMSARDETLIIPGT